MDPTVVATEGYTTYDVGAILIAATIAALSLFLIFGAIIGYRKSNTWLERLFAIVAISGGASIFVTLGFGAVVSMSDHLYFVRPSFAILQLYQFLQPGSG